MRSLSRVLSIGTALTSVFLATNTTWASQNSTLTLAQELAAISDIAPSYTYLAADPIQITAVSQSTSDMDNLSLGTATASTPIYWYADGSNNLIATGVVASAWKTFSGSPASSWSATTTESLTETTSNGSVASTVILKLILTKVGAAADLTRAALFTWLRSSSTATALAASNTGTLLSTTGVVAGTATIGWTAKAWIDNGSAVAVAGTLDPIEMTASIAATTAAGAGSTLTFTSALTNLHTWNLTTNSTTAQSLRFTATGGKTFDLNVYPGPLSRTTGIATSFLGAITNASNKRIIQSSALHLNTLPVSISGVRAMMQASPSGSIKDMMNSFVTTALGSATSVVGDFTTTADTNKYGLVATTPSNLTGLGWTLPDGITLTATGKVGTTGMAKAFTCSLAGIEVVKDDTNNVLKFTAIDGDSFWVKAFDTTGLDTTADTTVAASDRDTLLALQLRSALSSTATITTSTVGQILTASYS